MSEKISNNVRTACILLLTLIAGGGIIYACGAVTRDIDRNARDIISNAGKIDSQAVQITDLRLDAKDLKNLATRAVDETKSINKKLDNILNILNEQAKVQAVNSEKFKTLTGVNNE